MKFLSKFAKVEKLNLGWSADEKYYLESADGEQFCLRVSVISQKDKKQAEFNQLKRVAELDLRISEPVEFEVCEADQKVYQLLKWLPGEPLQQVLPGLPDEEQRSLGVEAGKALRKLHSIPAPDDLQPWQDRMGAKIARKLEDFKRMDIHISHERDTLRFIQDNQHWLIDRPQTFQHGDFHVGNLLLMPDGHLGIIDFNRWSWGDPWEEFDRMAIFSRMVSLPFTHGQIDGYFGEGEPPDFFSLMAFYTAITAAFSIPWAVSFGEEEVSRTLKRAEMIMDDYDSFKSVTPKWYRESDV